jgi:hypothetical protein
MKTNLVTRSGLVGVLALGFLTIQPTFGQNALKFTGVKATPEKAIQLYWASNTNELYEIDYASQLAGNSDGTTAWNKLYDDCPSQGANTFYLDTGNYDDSSPSILHPKNSPMRFYRIVKTGANTGSNPTVAIISPTNGSVVSGNITVTINASSDTMLVDTILYVDGQEMLPSDDGTNFVINTCEWWNGPHTLFAVAKSQSGLEGLLNNSSITYGCSVSAYTTVTFSNLISEFAFSQPFFEPALGQTQQVTATFAANCNWTLQILDISSNVVRTVTGSGGTMEFDWNGTGNGGASIPDGNYTYLISAQTNGGGSVGGNDGPPSPSFASTLSGSSDDAMELLAIPMDGSGAPVPLVLYPPGFDTNNFLIFEGSMADLQSQTTLARASFTSSDSGSFSPNYAGSSSQSTTGPMRPPINPVKGNAGTFGIAYQDYANGFSVGAPTTGWPYPLPVFVRLETFPYGSQFSLDPITEFKSLAKRFSRALQHNGWKPGFILGGDELTASEVQKTSEGGDSIFNSVDIGLLMGHGTYGSTYEDDYVKYSYFYFGSEAHYPSYLRLSDFDFGSGAQDGLKWMTILACNMLNPTAINSMTANYRMPINDNLHQLLGCTTVAYADSKIGYQYGRRMTGGIYGVEAVKDSWFLAGQWAYALDSLSHSVTFGTIGWPNCMSETVYSPNSPDTGGGTVEIDQVVY